MSKEKLTLAKANELLNAHMQNINLRRHCISVGKVLSAFYDYYKNEGRNVGNLTKEEWEIAGTLHDADYEETKNDSAKHTLVLLEWMNELDVPEEILEVFKTHNTKITKLKDPETLLEWTLECCDELTGFIVAVALVMPSKKLDDVTVESILKKFKQKEFSRAVDRSQIEQCENKLIIPLETFINVALKAMQDNSELLGL